MPSADRDRHATNTIGHASGRLPCSAIVAAAVGQDDVGAERDQVQPRSCGCDSRRSHSECRSAGSRPSSQPSSRKRLLSAEGAMDWSDPQIDEQGRDAVPGKTVESEHRQARPAAPPRRVMNCAFSFDNLVGAGEGPGNVRPTPGLGRLMPNSNLEVVQSATRSLCSNETFDKESRRARLRSGEFGPSRD